MPDEGPTIPPRLPAKPARQTMREVAALAKLAEQTKGGDKT